MIPEDVRKLCILTILSCTSVSKANLHGDKTRISRDSRPDGEESDELPAGLFSFPRNSMVESPPADTTSEAPVEETTPQAQIEDITSENTTPQEQIGHEARHGGLDVAFVPAGEVGQVQKKAV